MQTTIKRDWFANEIIRRFHTHKNTVIFFLGEPRMGKTYGALAFGEVADACGDFDVDHHVSMGDAIRFIELVEAARPGCVVVYDEPSRDYNARSFMTKMNKVLNLLNTVWGQLQRTVIFAVPLMKFTDLNARSLTNFTVRMDRQGHGVVYSHSVDVHTSKDWKKREGELDFSMPFRSRPDELAKYEALKGEFIKTTVECSKIELREIDMQDQRRRNVNDPDFIIRSIKERLPEFQRPDGTIDVNAVTFTLGLPERRVKGAKFIIEKELNLKPERAQ